MAGNRSIRATINARRRGPRVMRRQTNPIRRRRNIRKTAPSSSTSIGGLVATGVRTLTSFLPGQTVVRPVVDTILKALGLISAISLSGDNITATLRPIGLSANVPINFGNLLCECKNLGLQGINQQGLPTLTTNYDTGRVLKMIVTAEPTAKVSERSGDWAMAVVPIKQIADRPVISSITPNFEDLKNVPGAKYGPATRSLSVLWIPNVNRDSIAAMNQNFGDYGALACIMLAYSQEARSSYGNFSPDAFSVRFVVKTFAHFDEKMPMDSFAQSAGGVILQPNAVVPRSEYIGSFRGKKYCFNQDHVVSADDCVKFKVNKTLHPELFESLKAGLQEDALAEDFDNFSVVS